MAKNKGIKVVLNGPILDQLRVLNGTFSGPISALVRYLLADALAQRLPKVAPKPTKVSQGVGRPLDSMTVQRGKRALDRIKKTYAPLINSLKDRFADIHGRYFDAFLAAEQRKDWEYLDQFDAAQPWRKPWDRGGELEFLLPGEVATEADGDDGDAVV